MNAKSHGFRGKSWSTCKTGLLNLMTMNIDKENSVLLIFSALTKAFVCHSHQRQSMNVKNYGFENYLLTLPPPAVRPKGKWKIKYIGIIYIIYIINCNIIYYNVV